MTLVLVEVFQRQFQLILYNIPLCLLKLQKFIYRVSWQIAIYLFIYLDFGNCIKIRMIILIITGNYIVIIVKMYNITI